MLLQKFLFTLTFPTVNKISKKKNQFCKDIFTSEIAMASNTYNYNSPQRESRTIYLYTTRSEDTLVWSIGQLIANSAYVQGANTRQNQAFASYFNFANFVKIEGNYYLHKNVPRLLFRITTVCFRIEIFTKMHKASYNCII